MFWQILLQDCVLLSFLGAMLRDSNAARKSFNFSYVLQDSIESSQFSLSSFNIHILLFVVVCLLPRVSLTIWFNVLKDLQIVKSILSGIYICGFDKSVMLAPPVPYRMVPASPPPIPAQTWLLPLQVCLSGNATRGQWCITEAFELALHFEEGIWDSSVLWHRSIVHLTDCWIGKQKLQFVYSIKCHLGRLSLL